MAGSGIGCQLRPERSVLPIEWSTSRNAISAPSTLFEPYSAGLERAKKAAFAALAACATMARISQRML